MRSRELPSIVPPCVPGGTGISQSSPRAPWRFAPSPCRPRPARKCLLPVSAPRSRRDGSQTSTTSPPCPPSPPSGPPLGTCASRRKLTDPLPPPPPSTNIFALSYIRESVVGEGRAPLPLASPSGSARGQPPDALPASPERPRPCGPYGRVEFDGSLGRGKDRVVAAEAGALARPEAGAPLADDD